MNERLLNFEHFLQQGEGFFQKLYKQLRNMGLAEKDLSYPDHLCYRVATQDRYAILKSELDAIAECLVVAPVGGREISTFRLPKPFKVRSSSVEIDLVELPAPKPGSFYAEGFEHAEFVIEDDFLTFLRKYNNLKFEGPSSKKLNSEVRLQTLQGQAKFHHLPLEKVIELEKI